MSREGEMGEFPTEAQSSPIPVVYEHLGSTGMPKDEIMLMLDDIESHVEKIRKKAFQIEEERDAMFSALHAFRHSRLLEDLTELERDDINRYLDRIYNRCTTIDICVRTDRDKPQEEALYKINGIIDGLITQLHNDPTASKAKCVSFMNSCTSYSECSVEDSNFEQALLGCTVDDQQRVRRRLQGLLTYIEKLSVTI